MVKRIVILSLVGVLLATGALYYKFGRIDKAEHKAREELRAALRGDPAGQKAPAYVDGLIDHFHAAAFAEAFDRRHHTGGTIHLTEYERLMVREMIARAKADKADDVAQELERFAATRGLTDDPAPDAPAPDR